MNNSADLAIGMRVHTMDGVAGTIEALEQDAGADATTFLVRANDDTAVYRLSVMLITTIKKEANPPVVVVGVRSAGLESYRVGALPLEGASANRASDAGSFSEPAPVTAGTSGEGSYSAAMRTVSPASAAAIDAADPSPSTLRIPLHAEELVAETRSVIRGTLRLHKGVETIEQSAHLAVLHEEAVIEHLAPDQYRATTDDPDVVVIPIYEEQVMVEKRQVLKEYIRIRKHRVEEEQTVQQPVRREYLEVTEPARSSQEALAPSSVAGARTPRPAGS